MAARTVAPNVVVVATHHAKGTTKMLADFEYRFSQHEDTIRRAEANARLEAALSSTSAAATDAEPKRPRRGISLIIGRISGTAHSAA
jgi:hypothetical protein